MTESYCGKNCESCVLKENGACMGCRCESENRTSRDCEIVSCCRRKGHDSCGSCGRNGSCDTLFERERMLPRRQQALEAETARRENTARCAPILGTWLWPLLWLMIPANLAVLLIDCSLIARFPAISPQEQVLAAVFPFAYSLLLLQLSSVSPHYRFAGLCAIGSSVLNAAAIIIARANDRLVWLAVILFFAVALTLIGTYLEHSAHSAALKGVDDVLSEKWKGLWKWTVRVLYILLAGFVTLYTVRILGWILLGIAAAGGITVIVLRLILHYRTAKLFQAYPAGQK